MDFSYYPIKRLGKLIRSEVEAWVDENPDIEPDNLLGACAIASYVLQRALVKLGYKPKFVMADSYDGAHCWIELDDYVIDLTATQFNMSLPKVLITKKKYYYDSIPELNSYNSIFFNRKAVSLVKNWQDQSPIKYYKEINKLIKNLNHELYI